MAEQRRRVGRATVVAWAVLAAVAGSCGGGGRSLASRAEGTWACDLHETAPSLGGPAQAVAGTATARITADDDSHGTFEVELTGEASAGRAIALDGDWTLAGHDLEVKIRHDAFGGGGGTLEYRGVADDTTRLTARGNKADPFRPVRVAHHGSAVEFRWDPFDGEHARLTCNRG